MNMMFITFICKLMDNALSTLKSIYLHKHKYFVSSAFNAISTFFYMVAMVNVVKDNSFNSIIAMCVATFLGSYLPARIVERMEEDELYIYDITSNTFEEGVALVEQIRDLDIPIKTSTTYSNSFDKTLEIKVFCSTKQESIMIKEIVKDNAKYHAYIAKEY